MNDERHVPVLAPTTPEADDPTRQRILLAAKANLRRYGASKTTVVDIARDLGMSHSNVYRFFRTKAELLDAVVDEWLDEEAILRDQLLAQPGTAGERLERLILGLLARKRERWTTDEELTALYYQLLADRPASGQRLETITRAALVRIVDDGIASGELADLGSEAMLGVIQSVVGAFFSRDFVRRLVDDPAPAERIVSDTLRTLIAGFTNRTAPPRLGE